MTALDRKIADLRARRVGLRKAIERAAWIVDVVDKRRTIEALQLNLRATERPWRELNEQKDARDELRSLRHEVAMLRASPTRTAAAPVRRALCRSTRVSAQSATRPRFWCQADDAG